MSHLDETLTQGRAPRLSRDLDRLRATSHFLDAQSWANLLAVSADDTQADPSSVAIAAAPFLTRGVEINTLLVTLVDTITKNLKADRGTLYLVDGARRRLTSMIAHLPEIERIELAFGQGIAGACAEQGVVLNVADPPADPRHDTTVDQRTGYRTKSILAVPLTDSEEQTIGVLQLLNAERGYFSGADEKTARELAAQAGKVLEATSLYAELRQRAHIGEERPALAYRFNQIVGESDAMKQVYGLVEKAARTDATVLITGESGTGKELIARAIHVNSGRRASKLVKVDCTTLPEALIENELFGHEKGAFTGADQTVPGKLEVADGGTLFIDEIGELPLKLQGKLLRVLQDRELERVGGTKTIKIDVRIICATHRDLAKMVDDGKFREDLYYRVRVVPVQLPPLRERGEEDLLRLIEHFIQKFSRRHKRPIERITDNALKRLREHDYPGNIRELENCIESAVVLCDTDVIHSRDLPLPARRRRTSPDDTQEGAALISNLGDPDVTLHDVEMEHVRLVLEACNGNQSEAARRLGIGRNTLARKLAGES
jgi:Nif-specific regulatory protein